MDGFGTDPRDIAPRGARGLLVCLWRRRSPRTKVRGRRGSERSADPVPAHNLAYGGSGTSITRTSIDALVDSKELLAQLRRRRSAHAARRADALAHSRKRLSR